MTFVIARGTGTVGAKVTRELLAQSHHVRVLTRNATRAAERLGRHDRLELFEIDFSDPHQLGGGFQQGDRAFLGLGGSLTQVQDECALIDAAASAGVEHLVRLSCNGVDTATNNVILNVHRAIESHLADAAIPSTLVRPSTFIPQDAIARELPPEERDDVFAKVVAVAPGFGDYQSKTSRTRKELRLKPSKQAIAEFVRSAKDVTHG